MAGCTLTGNITKLVVPRSLVEKSNGFAMDIGGSVIKVVYLSKEEWEGEYAGNATSDNVSLYMTSCPKDNLDDAIKFVKNNVYICCPAGGQPPVIYTTGNGISQMAEKFNKEVNVKLKNRNEFDCFVKATDFLLKNYSASMVFSDFLADSFRAGIEQLANTTRSLEHWFKPWVMQQSNYKIDKEKFAVVREYLDFTKEKLGSGEYRAVNEPHRYPYILGQFGSGFVYLKVYEDLTCKMMDLTPLAGRSFLDLGCFITGAKTYEELITLAEKGNENNLNVRVCDAAQKVVGDLYSLGLQNERVIYNFGKTHEKVPDEINKADLARTLLRAICANVLKTGAHVMMREKCQDLYLAGSFVTSHVTQHILTKQFEAQRIENLELSTAQLTMADLRMRIIRGGGMLGALGTFLMGLSALTKMAILRWYIEKASWSDRISDETWIKQLE